MKGRKEGENRRRRGAGAEKITVTVQEMPKRNIAKEAISVRDVEEPRAADPEKQLEWLFECLGFGDKEDELAKEVFKELVQHKDQGVRSKEIQQKAGVTQGAVVYHLNTFMRSGMVVKQGRYYYMKRQTLDRTLEDMEEEMLRRFERMRKIAKMMEEEMERF